MKWQHNPTHELTLGSRATFGSLFRSSGSRPTQFYQPLIRFTAPAYRRMSWYGEWRYYGFAEPFYMYEGFRTHLLAIGLRYGI